MDLVIASVADAVIAFVIVAILVILLVGNAIRNIAYAWGWEGRKSRRRGATSAGVTSGSGWAGNPSGDSGSSHGGGGSDGWRLGIDE